MSLDGACDTRYDARMQTDPLADLERVASTDDDGKPITWVILATAELERVMWALVVEEADLQGPEDAMEVAVLELTRGEAGVALTLSEDEAAEEAAYAWFAEHMGLAAC
jgi:hypothetical protein